MSFSNLFGSPAPASPGMLSLQTDSPSSSFGQGSPRKLIRKKRKQAKLVNPAQSLNSFDMSLKAEDTFDNSGFNLTTGRFLAELSPESSAMALANESQTSISVAGNVGSAPPTACADEGSDTSSVSISPAKSEGLNAYRTSSTTPEGTPERVLAVTPSTTLSKLFESSSTSSTASQLNVDTSPSASTKPQMILSSPSSFAAEGSPVLSSQASVLRNRILSPIDNTVSSIRTSPSASASIKSFSSMGKTFAPLGKGSPGKSLPTSTVSFSLVKSNLSIVSSNGGTPDISASLENMMTPQKAGPLDPSTGVASASDRPYTPGTPDSEREVEHLTQSITTMEIEDNSSFHATFNRSSTAGPSSGRKVSTTPPDMPSTPAPSRFTAYDGMVTPARPSGLVPQTPRSILRPTNTPATGNSVRFNAVAFYKVIERLPGFSEPSLSESEILGAEGMTPVGSDPIEKSEVPMLDLSSSEEELEFQPTHHNNNNTLDSIDSDDFDEELERNTLANGQQLTDPLACHGSSMLGNETPGFTVDESLETTAKLLQDFVSSHGLDVKRDRIPSDATQRTVSGSTQRTVSSSSLNPFDLDEPIRHTSPLNPPCEEDGDVSHMENLNNSSEWVVPADLSFGDDSLPQLAGASFSIGAMVDPDATGATTRGITPRRPHSTPHWAGGDVPTISRTASSPEREDEMTPVAPIRTRLAAAKYVSTSPMKHASPSGSPRPGTSPRSSPPPPGLALRRSLSNDEESCPRIPALSISSPIPSPRKLSPTLPAVSEDEEVGNAPAMRLPKSVFQKSSSLTRARLTAFTASLRRSRSVFEDREDASDVAEPDSPVKPMLDGKAVSSLAGDISKLSLVEISGNMSKFSFLDRSRSRTPPPASTSAQESSGRQSPPAEKIIQESSTNPTVAALAPPAQAMFDAQAAYAKSLEKQLASYQDIVEKCQAEVADRDAQLRKAKGMAELIVWMREDMSIRAPRMDERITKLVCENSETEKALALAESEREELRSQVAQQLHANEELKAEVESLQATQLSALAADSTEVEELLMKLKVAEDELQFARSQLQLTANDASKTKEQLVSTETELLAAHNQIEHLSAQLEAADAQRTEADGLAQNLLAAQQEIDEFKTELRAANENGDDLKHALQEAHHRNDSLKAECDQVREEFDTLKNRLDGACEERDLLQEQLDTAHANYKSLEDQFNHVHDERDAFQSELKALRDELIHAEHKIESLNAHAGHSAELQEALDKAYAEVDSLTAQIADAKGVNADVEADLRDARDECASLTADLETARADVDHFRREARDEAHARAEAEHIINSLEDKIKHVENDLAEATAEIHHLEERVASGLNSEPQESKDHRIKQLEQKIRRLAHEREMMNVAVNSSQMETELLKRRIATLENTKSAPLRSLKLSPPGQGVPSSVPRRVPS